jgi:hypothetical protein
VELGDGANGREGTARWRIEDGGGELCWIEEEDDAGREGGRVEVPEKLDGAQRRPRAGTGGA